MKKYIFIGVAWPYVNGNLHIGHLAGYLLPADIFARFNRLIGNNVSMVSGSDCHGTPITIEAEKRGVTPQEIVDEYHPKHKRLFHQYGISFDLYTKTTTRNHKEVVQKIFVKLANEGLLFKDKVFQYYDEISAKFLPDRYVEGTCSFCGYSESRGDQCDKCGKILEPGELKNPRSKLTKRIVILKETEHYFFNWPKLEIFLKKYVKQRKKNWKGWINNEVEGWLKLGLKPRCITRDMDWGIPIPNSMLAQNLKLENSENKRIYVWFEAVIGYLSASIELLKKDDDWKKFWYGESKHYYFMGKDNLVFHALFWPGQLHGFDKNIHLPDVLMINQFLNLEGKKFSKSKNIIVDSAYIGEKYGVDATRFYLTSIMPEYADANFSWQDFVKVTNDLLIGKIGNFINRTLRLAEHIDCCVLIPQKDVEDKVEKILETAYEQINNCQYKRYIEEIVKLADLGNQYINQKEPWKKPKESQDYKQIMMDNLFIILALQLMFIPLIPNSADKIQEMISIKPIRWPKKNTTIYLKKLINKISIKTINPLFSKIDEGVIETEKEKLNLKD